ncbi:Translocation protein S66 [Basidiobolus ranarum]|uniref:Translocation protein S66 n=1 Tax=Basidiobolus ranarum TaxID=34480 RepID=A0ABR2VX65_9FUNG
MSIVLATGYVAGWAVMFGTFVACYHRRKALVRNKLDPWFPQHTTRDHYYALVELKPEADEFQLKAALLRRAMTDVERIMELQNNKGPLQQLVKTGAIGEDVWNQFEAAEKDMEGELMEVVHEANTFKEGWGQQIFPQASDMLAHERQKTLRKELNEQMLAEQEVRLRFEAKDQVRREQESKKAYEELMREESKAAGKMKAKN